MDIAFYISVKQTRLVKVYIFYWFCIYLQFATHSFMARIAKTNVTVFKSRHFPVIMYLEFAIVLQ